MDKALTLPELLETVPNDARLVLSNEDERGVDIISVGRLAREAAAELRRLHPYEPAYKAWHEKTEWVQTTARPGEFGMHRADVMRQRLEQAEAQRDALLEALQDLCDTLGECGMTEKARAAIKAVEEQPDPRRALDELARIDGELGLFNAPTRCPNCASLEAQHAELDDMLVAMEHAVAQAAAVERKACADICDAHASCEGIAQRCAADIRARGQA